MISRKFRTKTPQVTFTRERADNGDEVSRNATNASSVERHSADVTKKTDCDDGGGGAEEGAAARAAELLAQVKVSDL